jgi:hypothetical protein
MANRSKKVLKLRRYRDKLIGNNVVLNGKLRMYESTLEHITVALQKEDYLRAAALASLPHNEEVRTEMSLDWDKNEIIKELALVYRFLVVEREYTKNIRMAVNQRDYLRIAALAADHAAEANAHDKMLTLWSQDHGFTKSLREREKEDEDVA